MATLTASISLTDAEAGQKRTSNKNFKMMNSCKLIKTFEAI